MSLFNSSCGMEKIEEILKSGKASVYFLGILGAGMAPLAELLHSRGMQVAGSDRVWNSTAGRLSEKGIKITPQHKDALPEGVSAVVYSLAIDERAPEILRARKSGIPLISRAELLGWAMKDCTNRIGVSGSHGKSSTVAIAERIFSASGADPTVVSGADLSSIKGALRIGNGESFIYEACEYKDSFLCTSPTLAVITGIELDHTDYFLSKEQLKASFLRFALSARQTVLNIDCLEARSLLPLLGQRAVTYGACEDADYKYEIHNMSAEGAVFSVRIRQGETLKLRVPALGSFVVKNTTAAIAVADLLNVSHKAIKEAVGSYRGICRRLERIGVLDGRAVFYDYAHHPTEIKEAISSVRSAYGACTVVFRPHTYSRTASLWTEFVSSLREAEHVCLVDIYPAREEPVSGVTSEALARAIGKKAVYLRQEEVYGYVSTKTEGPVILMGAGDVERIKKDFVNGKNS